jgi:hypothetical protein
VTHCRTYIFTGYCFCRRTETETFAASLCPECDRDFRFDRKLNVVLKSEKDKGFEKRDVWTGERLDGEGILDEKEGLMGSSDDMKEQEMKILCDGNGDGDGGMGREREREEERDAYREPEYYRDSARVHGRRKAKPAFGSWEIIERHEIEGYESFVRAQASAHEDRSEAEEKEEDACQEVGGQKKQSHAYSDSETEKVDSGREEQKEQKLTWFNGIDGEVSSVKEFGRLDRPRMIGLTMNDIWSDDFFKRGRHLGRD